MTKHLNFCWVRWVSENWISLGTGALAAMLLAFPAWGDDGGITTKDVLNTGRTVTDQQIHYPDGAPAQITAQILTVRPGAETPWHVHNVPMFVYILEGEITVDYGELGKKTLRAGEALVEAIATPHVGHNSGSVPTKILVVNMGLAGLPNARIVDAPTGSVTK